MKEGQQRDRRPDSAIRNAARAIIVRDQKILLLRKSDDVKGERFALPGGAQDPGETLQQALSRECLEEIGTDVTIRDLLHVADYFKPRHTVPPSTRQLVEFLFSCDVPGDYRPRHGHHPDKHQVEVLWKPLVDLPDLPLLPHSLAGRLSGEATARVYLGTID
ncbi:MAG: NUDIX domain-containing protein [bacterium]|nr:NUDIX domain-containing protein [bacterium]